MTLALYGHPFSSYTWKAQIALYANGTPFEFREFTEHLDFVAQAHPAGRFPILQDGAHTVIEATAIIEYLAVHHPGPAPLIPADPAQAIIARMMDRVFDNYVMTNMQRMVAAHFNDLESGRSGMRDTPDSAQAEKGRAGLRRVYDWLEKWLGENQLPPHVSLVTCAAAPSLFYADWVERIPESCPRLAALRAEILALDAVSRCVEEARPYRAYFPPGAPDRD